LKKESLIVIITVFVLGVASIFAFSNVHTTGLAVANNYVCTDSDGGLNFDVLGKVDFSWGRGGYAYSRSDYCASNKVLYEVYCNQYNTLAYQRHDCPVSCSNGACSAEGSTSCTNDCSYAGQRSCEGTTGYKVCGDYDSDACLDWSPVTNCYSNQYCSASGYCTTSSVCTNGQTKSCGSNVGVCKFGTQTCINGAWGLCIGAVNPTIEVCNNNLDDDCDSSVDEGCSVQNYTSGCFDSDGSFGYPFNYYTKGYVTAKGETKWDYCSGSTVYEYVCYNYSSGEGWNVGGMGCPNGCSDGACVSQSSCTADNVCTLYGSQPVTLTLDGVAYLLNGNPLGGQARVDVNDKWVGVLKGGTYVLNGLKFYVNEVYPSVVLTISAAPTTSSCEGGLCTIIEGSSATTVVNGINYELKLLSVMATNSANLSVNNKANLIYEGNTYTNIIPSTRVIVQSISYYTESTPQSVLLNITGLLDCVDGDGGLDYYTKSWAMSRSGVSGYGDECFNNDSISLRESWCDPVTKEASQKSFICPYACSNGACVKPSSNYCKSGVCFIYNGQSITTTLAEQYPQTISPITTTPYAISVDVLSKDNVTVTINGISKMMNRGYGMGYAYPFGDVDAYVYDIAYSNGVPNGAVVVISPQNSFCGDAKEQRADITMAFNMGGIMPLFGRSPFQDAVFCKLYESTPLTSSYKGSSYGIKGRIIPPAPGVPAHVFFSVNDGEEHKAYAYGAYDLGPFYVYNSQIIAPPTGNYRKSTSFAVFSFNSYCGIDNSFLGYTKNACVLKEGDTSTLNMDGTSYSVKAEKIEWVQGYGNRVTVNVNGDSKTIMVSSNANVGGLNVRVQFVTFAGIGQDASGKVITKGIATLYFS
jgi:hypothetical protein